jgi:hypothetical protein
MSTKPRTQTKLDETKSVEDFLKQVYTSDLFSEEEFKAFMETIQYQGFNREETLKLLTSQVQDPKIIAELAIACALRGPQAGSTLKLTNGKTSVQMGIPPSGGKGSKQLTMSKILACTADLAAFYLKKANVPKRIESDLPGWLQFPSAGSILLPERERSLHREFSKKFSLVIGGTFNEGIYEQMVRNAYCDSKLKLF